MKVFRIINTIFLHSILLAILVFTSACNDNQRGCKCSCKWCSENSQCKSYKKEDNKRSTIQKNHTATFGIDVSHHNGDIDWKLLSTKHDLSFVYIKATEGATHMDKNYLKNAKGASAVGYLIGSYHFFRMTSSAHAQFDNFDRAMTKAGFQQLIPMVDIETSDRYPVAELRDSLNVFISLIKKKYGVYPMIYGTNKSYNTYCGSAFNKYHLYIGRYGKHAPIISGEGHYTIWQYSEKGRLSGIPKPVDFAKFHPEYSIIDILLPHAASL